MDYKYEKEPKRSSCCKKEWRFERTLLVTVHIFLFVIQCDCQTILKQSSHVESATKRDINKELRSNNLDLKLDSNHCHSCHPSSSKFVDKDKSNDSFDTQKHNLSEDDLHKENDEGSFLNELLTSVNVLTEKYLNINRTEKELENELEHLVDDALSKDRYEIIKGVEIKTVEEDNVTDISKTEDEEGRALFSSYTYEYRLFQKIKNFINTHIISIDLAKTSETMDFRTFGLKKLFLPFIIGIQLFKGMLFAMFLPSILGSFGKILGKGISHLSAASSQASYPPANGDDQPGYNNENKDLMGYDTEGAASYLYPQEGGYEPSDINDLSNVDMSRFGVGGQKVSYLPSKNGYYQNQIQSSNQYKVFQKIPASSMILSNYDPFYSPLLSRLDGIFARLGLVPTDNSLDGGVEISGHTLSDVKLESCREQLICLMYSSPAKYAPYSNLVSAQLSRELNELRRPVSDNPEILRFFRYMRAARRGQEGMDCIRAHPACSVNTAPAHTMIAAYHDINKLVTARKLRN